MRYLGTTLHGISLIPEITKQSPLM